MYLIKPGKNLFFVFMCFDTKFVTPKPLFDTSFKKFDTGVLSKRNVSKYVPTKIYFLKKQSNRINRK